MASAPKTAGFHLATSQGKGGRIERSPLLKQGSKQFLKWTGSRPAKPVSQVMQETQDRIKRTRPLAALGRRVANARHDIDMYRIGGGAVKNIPGEGRGPGARVKPTISFVKDATGKIIPERKARTLQMRNSPFRRELPSGPPSMTDMPAASIRGAGGRMVSNPDYAKWKNSHLEYNSALSRQQLMQPNNRVIQTIQTTSQTPTEKYTAPITKTYVRRGGLGKNSQTPSSEALSELNTVNPYIQVA